jgi:hypothetical protein
MIIKQRTTAIDPLLFDIICPFLRATGLDRAFPVARLWNRVVVPEPELAVVSALNRAEPILTIEAGRAA